MPDLTIEARVAACRAVLEAGEGLPDWKPTRWVNAIAYRLGQAALHAQRFEEAVENTLAFSAEDTLLRFSEDLVVVAAAAMDALQALEQRAGDGG